MLCGSYHWENDHNDSNVYVKLTDYQKKKIFTLTFYLLCSYPDIELYYINMENSYDFYLIHEKISHHQFDDVKMKDWLYEHVDHYGLYGRYDSGD